MTRRVRWQLAIVLLTAITRVVAAASVDPAVLPDSERYRNDADPLLPLQVWDGYGPGVLSQIVNLLPLSAAVLLQTTLAALLWGAAAIYAAALASERFSWPAFLLIWAWSLSPWFLLWDTWVLTESLTMAGCALGAVGIAATLARARHAPWIACAGLAVAITARPFVAAILLPLMGLALLWPLSAARLRAVAAPLAATTALGLFASWQVLTFTSAETSPFSYLPEPESLTQVQATDRFAGRGHLPGYLDLARTEGMPSCPEAEAIAMSSETAKIDRLREITACPEFDAWLAAGGLPWTREFAGNLGPTVDELVQPTYWLRAPVAEYVPFDSRFSHLQTLVGDGWDALVLAVNAIMLALTTIVTAAVLLVRGQRTFLLASLALIAAVSVYMWGTDGIEYWRHLLPVFPVLLPLAVTLLACKREAA